MTLKIPLAIDVSRFCGFCRRHRPAAGGEAVFSAAERRCYWCCAQCAQIAQAKAWLEKERGI